MSEKLHALFVAQRGNDSCFRPKAHFGDIVTGACTTVFAKHSKHFCLEDSLAIDVDRMQRNFGPLKNQG